MQLSNMGILAQDGVTYKKVKIKGTGTSNDHLLMLLDLIEGFNRFSDFNEIVAEIGKATKSIMQAEASSLLLLDNDSDELCFQFCTGPVSEELTGKRIPRDHGFSGWVAEHKLPLIANNIDKESVKYEIFGGEVSKDFTTKNIICAPLLDSDNNLLGVIEAINRSGEGKISEDDISIFQALANHAASAIERCRDLQKRNSLLSEQDMYLTEIHHRVKNDLALISGIVEIESLDIENEDARHVLRNIQSRIKSMAVVYELLSNNSAQENTEVGTYFNELAEGISYGLNNREKSVDINISADPVVLDPYKSLSCGLILNELMLNTYKHAFDQEKRGSINVELLRDGDTITMNYRDSGPGLPDDFRLEDQDSLGFNMIHALVAQLEGTFEIIGNASAHFRIKFRAASEEEKSNSRDIAS